VRTKGKLEPIDYVIAGASAGMTEAFINCPFEVVKVRMQAKENVGYYNNTLNATIAVVKEEGFFALYKGFEPQVVRNGVWNGAYFGIISRIKDSIGGNQYFSSHVNLLNFIAGTIAGSVATTLNTPFDVVKSRNQNIKTGVAPWSIPALFQIYSNEGFVALYRGYVARMLRLGPGGGIMMVAFEFFNNLMR